MQLLKYNNEKLLIRFLDRCIEDGQKSMAFGLRAQLTRLFGSIPGPIIFGMFIDKTCLHWGQSCDGQGSCDIYEFKNMS